MLAYRHAFHAGNHADVLKHLVLTRVLRYMGEKDKPYTLIDTHAGAGGYSVEGRYAQKNAEYGTGIAKLYDDVDELPAPLADYVQLVRDFNPDGQLRQYPGSPAIANVPPRCVIETSSAETASSATITFGSSISERAIAIRWR